MSAAKAADAISNASIEVRAVIDALGELAAYISDKAEALAPFADAFAAARCAQMNLETATEEAEGTPEARGRDTGAHRGPLPSSSAGDRTAIDAPRADETTPKPLTSSPGTVGCYLDGIGDSLRDAGNVLGDLAGQLDDRSCDSFVVELLASLRHAEGNLREARRALERSSSVGG